MTSFNERTVETRVFEKAAVDFDALVPYGFTRGNDGFRYETTFMDGAFIAAVTVGFSGKTTTAVYDADTREEYLPLLLKETPAGYPAEVKAACESVLAGIKKHCFNDTLFSGEQANRLANALRRRYGENPDFPWEGDDEDGVFRHAGTKKWYALFMTVGKGKLTGDKTQTEPVCVVNFKAAPEKILSLLAEKGFFPAYHMNKKTWVTAVLNDTIPDGVLLSLINESRSFALPEKGKKR